MSGKRDSARAALQRAVPFLHDRHHTDILNELENDLLDVENKRPTGGEIRAAATDLPKRPLLTPLQASQARGGANKDLLRSVTARAARLGFRIESDKLVDVAAFDAAAKGKDISERIALKAAMFKLGLIAA